jgi:hypothetical protein
MTPLHLLLSAQLHHRVEKISDDLRAAIEQKHQRGGDEVAHKALFVVGRHRLRIARRGGADGLAAIVDDGTFENLVGLINRPRTVSLHARVPAQITEAD